MAQKTCDQLRAEYAWEKIEELVKLKVDIKAYTSLTKSTASLIMNSGLMQTLAFLKSKQGEEHKVLLEHLLGWRPDSKGTARYEVTMTELYQSDSAEYMRRSREIMALLRWIRQFADAKKSMEKIP